MTQTFKLRLLTPVGPVYAGEVEQVTAENSIGQFGVLPQHIDFMTSLIPCVVEIKLPDATMLYYVISGGLAEVKDGEMTVLADLAEDYAALDNEQVEGQIREAEEALAVNMYAENYPTLMTNLMLAQARRRIKLLARSARSDHL